MSSHVDVFKEFCLVSLVGSYREHWDGFSWGGLMRRHAQAWLRHYKIELILFTTIYNTIQYKLYIIYILSWFAILLAVPRPSLSLAKISILLHIFPHLTHLMNSMHMYQNFSAILCAKSSLILLHLSLSLAIFAANLEHAKKNITFLFFQ